jgi:4-amino-4-deoxy-L-arabinose transferase-like glycosyltransferase
VSPSRVFLLLSTLWCLTMGAILGLTDQEAYYWTWSLRPDLGYFEHPPLQAWLTALVTGLLGSNAFAVRLVPLVARLIGFYFFAVWVRRRLAQSVPSTPLANRLATDGVVLTMACSFLGLAMGLLALPDCLLFMFGMLTMLSSEAKKPLNTGFFLGLAALSKWIAIGLVPGVMWHLRVPGNLIKTLRNWSIAGALSLVIQAPVLYWNSQHNWVTFRFHLSDRFKHLGPDWPPIKKVVENFLGFSASQVLLVSLSVFAIAFIWATHSQVRRNFVRPRLGTWIWILPFYLIFGSAALRGELRFYWTAFACFPLALAIFESWPKLLMFDGLRRSLWACGLVTMTLVSVVLVFPVGAWLKPITDTYKSYDLRHSPRGDLDGWREFSKSLKEQALVDDQTAVMASNFRIAAQMIWALDLRSPDSVGVANWTKMQFSIWPQPQLNTTQFKKAIFVSDNRYWIIEHFQRFCAEPLSYRDYEVQRMGHTVKKIKWASCASFRPDPAAEM